MIHIEGMGWLGSALARNLAHASIEFTWSDTEEQFCAWPACTGIVYPAGDGRSQANLAAWAGWLKQGLFAPDEAQQVAYCYAHAKPPHKGRYGAIDLGWLRVAAAPCFSVHVPQVVTETRQRYAARRITTPPPGVQRVVAHGFNSRRVSYMWGWSAKVGIELPDDLINVLAGRVPAFYARAHRFQMVYAYPIPGEPGKWWAGSSLVATTTARPNPEMAQRALKAWVEAFPQCYPNLTLTEVGEPLEGWRPRGAHDDELRLERDGDTLMLPPLWHSGVRWAPDVINQCVKELRATPALKGTG